MNRDWRELEKRIGYSFKEKRLLRQAMTHSSFANEHNIDKLRCNERLEFLGDAVLEVVSSDREHKQRFYDSKTILQEIVQARENEEALEYEILKESGPDHNKVFEVRAVLGGQEIGRGTGRTKKAAEQVAAYRGILKLREQICT